MKTEHCCQLIKAIALPILGFLLVQWLIIPLGRILLNHLVLSKIKSLRKRLRKFGSWAVVTGATDGIGRAYVEQLARDGLNIVLVSRTIEKLRDVASNIESVYGVRTKTIAVDFSQLDIYGKLEDELTDLDVACLVNNVGVGYPHPNYFVGSQAFDVKLFDAMIHTNCNSMVRMTRLLLPRLLRTGGAIINVASSSGLQPTPYLTVYSATKAFAITFSKAVASEAADMASREVGGARKRSPVTVQTVAPFFVATKMSRIRSASFAAPSPADYTNQALNLLGVEDFTVGCLSHALQHLVLTSLPTCVASYILAYTMRSKMKVALKKAAAAAGKEK